MFLRIMYVAIPLVVGAIFGCLTTASAKTGSHIVTAQMRANALANVEKYDWAKAQQQKAINLAKPYVEMSDEELWRMVPSQWVPRNCGVHNTAGCPSCGDEFFKIRDVGYRRYAYNSKKHPWKLQCKNCKTLFPANDYGAYYRSGLDERGEFDPEKADKSLLFNPDHPDPKDPEHKKWVDDGFGLKYGEANLTIIAHYTYLLWSETMSAAQKLAHAYALTSDPIYAHKAAILVDRFADIYPNIDYRGFVAKNGWGISDGGSHMGMILGRIWETSTASHLSYAYDAIYEQLVNDAELVAFCSQMRQEYPGLNEKPDTQAIVGHIEDNLITLFCEAVTVQNIRGNVGSTERAMAMAAIALDRPGLTDKYLDWLFEESYRPIPEILVDMVDRDGPSFEASTSYSLSPRSLYPVADLLRAYKGYTKYDIYRDYPKMKQIFMATKAFRCLDQVTPKIGDSGKYMSWNIVLQPIPMLISGFRAYGTEDIAHELWRSAGYDLEKLEAQVDIFDENPEELIDRLIALKPALPLAIESINHSGYGLAILQTAGPEGSSLLAEEDTGRCVYVSYGRTCGSHPHKDRLNMGIFAKHFVMNPDLAYPEFTGSWPKRHAWTNHTMSHNTVTVNDRKQTCNWGGKTKLFIGGDTARIAIIDGGPAVYEGLRTYRRAVSLIDVSTEDSYVVDVFWVRGGTNHRMVNNGGGREVTHANLELEKQPTGTFAGPDIEFGAKLNEPGAREYQDAPAGCAAFSYLRDVERGNATSESCWIDWDMLYKTGEMPEGRDPHLRMHCLSPVDEIAIAIGEPPHHRYQDDYLKYVIRSHLGEDIETQFVTVLEPYEAEPFIRSARARRLHKHDGEGFAAAIQVDLKDGRSDIIIIAEQPCHVEAAGLSLDGQMGFVRLRDVKVEAAKLVRGTKLQYQDYILEAERGEICGKLSGFDVTDWNDNLLKVQPSVLPDGVEATDLIGRYIIVDNSERSDGSYLIKDVRENGTVISLGDKTLIERFIDPKDYDKGYIYNVVEGDEFTIPLSVAFEAKQPH